jgi:hypothetical protein
VSPGTSFEARRVAQKALLQKAGIDAALLVSVDKIGIGNDFRINLDFVALTKSRHSRYDEQELRALERALTKAAQKIPRPVRSAENAAYRCAEWDIDSPKVFGGHVRGGTKVKLSSKALTMLLAGKVTMNEFLEAQDWCERPGGMSNNPFARMLAEGRMIKSVKVESLSEKDDDWIEIEYGDPDPAAAPFVIKKRSDGK